MESKDDALGASIEETNGHYGSTLSCIQNNLFMPEIHFESFTLENIINLPYLFHEMVAFNALVLIIELLMNAVQTK